MPKEVTFETEGLAGTLTVKTGPEIPGFGVFRDDEMLETFSKCETAEAFLCGYREGWRAD
jgi:hypothetical protein